MIFCRVGGLSPVKHKLKNKKFSFHFPPPTRKGIYAFIWPYIESFLFMWSDEKQKEFKINGYRKFKYNGPIWCHFDEESKSIKSIRSWVYTDTEHLKNILKKVMINDRNQLIDYDFNSFIQNPYKRGLCGGVRMSKDHLEVYIEKKYLGRIRRE